MNSLTSLSCDIILDYIKRISHKIQWITVQKSCRCIIFPEFILKDALICYDFTYIKPIDKWKALKCHHTKFEKERYSLIKDKKKKNKSRTLNAHSKVQEKAVLLAIHWIVDQGGDAFPFNIVVTSHDKALYNLPYLGLSRTLASLKNVHLLFHVGVANLLKERKNIKISHINSMRTIKLQNDN